MFDENPQEMAGRAGEKTMNMIEIDVWEVRNLLPGRLKVKINSSLRIMESTNNFHIR